MLNIWWLPHKYQRLSTVALLCAAVISLNVTANPLSNMQKVGEARLKVLFWDIYDSALYTTDGHYQAERFPQALDIIYLRDIKASELLETTKEQWQKLGIEHLQASRWLADMADIFPDIKQGDRLTLVVGQTKQSEFFFNSKAIGSITDPAFGPDFLRIWLDENSSFPKVRHKLIGKNQ